MPRERFDPVDFLLWRRFGDPKPQPDFPRSFKKSTRAPTVDREADNERLRGRAAYERELRSLPLAEVQALATAALAEDAKEREARFEFNKPPVVAFAATFDHWAKAAYWSLDEAAALLTGRDPSRVQWKRILSCRDVSCEAAQMNKLRDLVLRAGKMGQLSATAPPGMVLAWATRNRIVVPAELDAAVRNHGHQVADWKTAYDHEKARADAAEAVLRERGSDNDEPVAPPRATETLTTKERESLLKMIIVMAVDGYGYDPAATRSPTAKEIAGHMATHGLPLDEDTVRKYLREARELLPPQRDEAD